MLYRRLNVCYDVLIANTVTYATLTSACTVNAISVSYLRVSVQGCTSCLLLLRVFVAQVRRGLLQNSCSNSCPGFVTGQ
jgi:hypothetical protein